MEGGGEHVARPDEYGIVVAAGEDLDAGAEAADARRADEDHLHGAARQGGVGVEDDRIVLAAVGIALDVNVENAEAALGWVGHVLCEEDASGASAEHGPGADKGVKDGVEAGAFEVLEEGR